MRRIATLAIVLVAALGCAAEPSPSDLDLPLVLAVPTIRPINAPPGVPVACAGVGLEAMLHGNPNDPRVAWLVSRGGGRIDVVWPLGYRAAFTPTLQVLDASGKVVLVEGSPVEGGCVTDVQGVLLLEPPFR